MALAAASVFPSLAVARDGTISPPTCVSIQNAAENCPPREPKAAAANAKKQLTSAQQMLKAAEKEAGHPLAPGESQNGEPELVDFWQAEVERLAKNRQYLVDVRSQFLPGTAGSSTAQPSNLAPRLFSRLVVSASNVQKEVDFWCEAVGMQKYMDLPGGAKVVAFGPPGLKADFDEGGFFSVEIRPAASSTAPAAKPGPPDAPQLSFVQVATPSLIRISKVLASGGELIDGYGYYNLRSPAGVDVRAYVEDRRDPVEFVALLAPRGKAGVEALGGQLAKLGLQPKGPYKLVTPETQAYMPTLPEGNVLYAGTFGEAAKGVQVLVLPQVEAKKEKSFFDNLPRAPSLITDEEGKYNFGVLDQEEAPTVSACPASGVRLSVMAPAGAGTGGAAAPGAGRGVALELVSAAE